MKKIITWLYVLVYSFSALAQEGISFYHLGSATLQSTGFNASYFPKGDFFIGLPILSGISLYSNNRFSYDDVVVKNGDILAEVVPDNANLRLKVSVQTKDIAFVGPEFKAKIAFTSYDMAIYGQFDGIVKTVSASTTLDSDGVPYYTAIVEVDDKEIERLDNIRIQSGMQASVSIISQKRTVLSYLFNALKTLLQPY